MQISALLAPPIPSTNIAPVYSQTSTIFLRDVAGSLIRKLYDYLGVNARRGNQIKNTIPLVKRAVELYIAQNYTQSITQCFQVYLTLEALRANVSQDLPPL